MRPSKLLRVLANPWLHIHIYADGVPRPACAVPVDLAEHVPGPTNRCVGARIESVVETQKRLTMRVGTKSVQRRPKREEIYWAFASDPETIPNTGYYRDRIQEGALIPADAETAKLAGVPFVEPAQALALARETAIAAFNAANGPLAFESAQPEPEPLPEHSAGSASVPEPQTARKPARSKDAAP